MKWMILILVMGIFTGCEQNCLTQTSFPYYQRDPKWILADEIYHNEIEKKVFQQLTRGKKLRPCESGWALLGGEKIQLMHCGFFYYGEISIEEARDLLLTTANLYLKVINENERIRPLLEFYPFTSKDVEIRVFILAADGSESSAEKLQFVRLINGKLQYDNETPGTRFLNRLHTETYEEAMSKFCGSAQISSLEDSPIRVHLCY